MEHYSNYFEQEEEKARLQSIKKVNEDFDKLGSKLSYDDKRFINNIMDNLEDYKTFFKVLKNC